MILIKGCEKIEIPKNAPLTEKKHLDIILQFLQLLNDNDGGENISQELEEQNFCPLKNAQNQVQFHNLFGNKLI